MQLSMLKKHRAALFLAFSASAIEFIYAGITVQFHLLLTANPEISLYFKLITAIALIALGIWNLSIKTSEGKSIPQQAVTGRHGFYRGTLLGLLNPMTIPFWLAMTAYLENDKLVEISGSGFWIYLAGLSSGTFFLLLTVDALGKRFSNVASNPFLVKKIPGIILLLMGGYFLVKILM